MFLDPISLAIYKTLIYADIFEFPLTSKEIVKYLIWEEKEHPPRPILIFKKLKNLNIPQKYPYYYLKNHQIIKKRKKRTKIFPQKWLIAQKAADILKKIPTIKLLALSGNTAVGNADEEDDIDFFIITQKNTLWLTRFLAILFLEIKKIRRRPNSKDFKNKICLNLLLDEDNLTLPLQKQNLYNAHEIIQIKVLVDKGNTYKKFLLANSWVKDYLPNSFMELNRLSSFVETKNGTKNLIEKILEKNIIPALNYFLMYLELFFMKKKRTNEIISSQYLFLHPQDLSKKVLDLYQKRLKKLIL